MAPHPHPSDAASLLADTRWLRALARRLLAADAEDVAQEAWLAARSNGASVPRAWLAGVVRHLVLRQHRAERTRRRHEALAARAEAAVPPAADEVARVQTQRRVLDAVLALPEPHRHTIIRRFLDGHGARAIARADGITPAAVRQRVARGLAMLRARLTAAAGDRGAMRCALLGLCLPARGPATLATAAAFTMSTKLFVPVLVTAAAVLAWLGFAVFAPPAAAPLGTPPPVGAALSVPKDPTAPAAVPGAEADHAPRRAAAAPGALARADRDRDLHGIVVDEEGRRIAGAELRVRRNPTSGFTIPDLEYAAVREEIAAAESDAAGEFAIPLATGVPVELHARAADFAPAVLLDRYAGERVTVTMARGAGIVCRVHGSDGRAIAGASVRVWCFTEVSGSAVRAGDTGPDGTFHCGDLAAGPVRIEVIPRAAAPAWSTLRLAPGTTTEVDVEVSAGVMLRGRVTDAATGAPIAGAEIGLGWTFRRKAATDALGHYEMPGFPPDDAVYVRAAGFGRDRKLIGAVVDGVAVVVDFALQPGRRVVGRVVDPGGAPCAGVYVAACGTMVLEGLDDTDWRAGRTGDDGRFELTDLAADRDHTLVLKRDGFATVAYDLPERARRESPFDAGALELQPAASLRGVLLDTDGRPLPDGIVHLRGVNADRDRIAEGRVDRDAIRVGTRLARTDDLGRFTFADLAAATYAVHVRRAGGLVPSSGGSVTLAAGEDRRDLYVTIQTLSIEGRVVDEAGRGLADVLVHDSGGGAGVLTDASGRFRMEGLAAGPHALQAVITSDLAGGRSLLPAPPTPIDAGSTGVELVMRRAATIRGVVLDASGAPVPNARVWAEDGAGGFVTSALAAADGSFVLAVAPGAIVDVLARAGREDETLFVHARDTAGPRAQQKSVPAPAEGLMLRLPPAGR